MTTPANTLTSVSLADQLRGATLIVAVSGESASSGAISIAHALAARYGAHVQAIQVLDTSPVALPAPLPSALAIARGLIGDAPYAADVDARHAEFAELTGQPNDWPVRLAVGVPAEEILRHARSVGAPLIVMGLSRHGLVDRVLRDETTLTVARYARAAVLGVVPSLRGLPRKAMVGVDFGPTSMRAARAALDLLARPATPVTAASLRLVYVDRYPDREKREDTIGDAVITRLGVEAAFEQLVRQLDPPPHVHVDWVTLRGTPAEALLAFADENEVDLIAVGCVHNTRLEEWMLGSVATEVVRDGRTSVLVMPSLHE